MPHCSECRELREVYWRRIEYCETLRAAQRKGSLGPNNKAEIDVALEDADNERVAARDALQSHQMRCPFCR